MGSHTFVSDVFCSSDAFCINGSRTKSKERLENVLFSPKPEWKGIRRPPLFWYRSSSHLPFSIKAKLRADGWDDKYFPVTQTEWCNIVDQPRPLNDRGTCTKGGVNFIAEAQKLSQHGRKCIRNSRSFLWQPRILSIAKRKPLGRQIC
jgi:hypothetical protein